MKTIFAIALGFCVTGVTACDTIPKPGTRSYLSVVTRPQPTADLRTIGTLFVWSNEVNAGMIYEGGHVCMQRAMTMSAMSAGGGASVPSSLVSLSEAARTALQTDNSESAVVLAGAIREAAASLSTTTERTAFLDIGMFYLCQLEANRAITPDQAALLVQQLIRDGSAMKPVAGFLPGVEAPEIAGLPNIVNVGTRRPSPPSDATDDADETEVKPEENKPPVEPTADQSGPGTPGETPVTPIAPPTPTDPDKPADRPPVR